MTRPRRARAAQDKEARAQEILAAAARLFDREAYASVTMAAVAREASLAKGTVYLYFETKEALFLAVFEDRMEGWFRDVMGRLVAQAGKGGLTGEAIGRLVARSLADRATLMRLQAILASVLEHNIDVTTALAFKLRMVTTMNAAAGLLEQGVEALRPGDGVRFLMRMHALVVGLYPQAYPAPAVAEALKDPALAALRVTSFEDELAEVVVILLRGWPRE